MAGKVKFLLAEDNRGDVILVQEGLDVQALNHELIVCRDGAEMMERVEQIDAGEAPCPDLALLDLNLPVHDGQVLLKRLRQSPVCADVPVIIVTSSDAPADREVTASLGANYYFRKPSDYD